jgi:hypothetical protein
MHVQSRRTRSPALQLAKMTRLEWSTDKGPASTAFTPALQGDTLTLGPLDIRTVKCSYRKVRPGA